MPKIKSTQKTDWKRPVFCILEGENPMHKSTNRLISLALTLIIALSFIPAVSAATIESSKSTAVTVTMGERGYFLNDQNGNRIGGSYWQYTANKEGVTGPAYCIAHGLKAVPENVSLPIKNRYETNPKVLGAFACGYPQVALADFIVKHNLTGLTEAEYMYATQLAIWASLGQLAVEGTQFTSGAQRIKAPTGDAQQIRVYKAVQLILAGAATWTRNQWRGLFVRYQENVIGNTLDLFHQDGLEGLVMDDLRIERETINGTDYYTIVYYTSSATPTTPNGDCIDITPYGVTETILVNADTNELLETKQNASGSTAFLVPTTGPVQTGLNANGANRPRGRNAIRAVHRA